MTRKGIESDSSPKVDVRNGAGIVLIFAGMISLGVARVFTGTHWGQGIKIGTFFGGIGMLGLGFALQGRKRRSR
jgi:hypothetical protein